LSANQSEPAMKVQSPKPQTNEHGTQAATAPRTTVDSPPTSDVYDMEHFLGAESEK